MKFKLFTLLFILSPLQVSAAGHVRDATIISVYCGYEGTYNMCSVAFDKPITTKDTCHTINSSRMQFKADGTIGGSLLSLALTAHTTQKKVHVYSTGECTIYNGLADIQYIEIIN